MYPQKYFEQGSLKTTSIGPDTVGLAWKLVPGGESNVDAVKLIRFRFDSKDTTTRVIPRSNTAYTDRGLPANTRYGYSLRATLNNSSHETTNEIRVTTLANRPSNLRILRVKSDSVELGWDHDKKALSYRVYWTQELQRWSDSTDTEDVSKLSKIVGGLTGNTRYFFKVVALNKDSVKSETSDVKDTVTLANSREILRQ